MKAGKALDFLHFVSTVGTGEAEVTGLQRNFWCSRSFGHVEISIHPGGSTAS